MTSPDVNPQEGFTSKRTALDATRTVASKVSYLVAAVGGEGSFKAGL